MIDTLQTRQGATRVVHVVLDLHEGGLERVVTDLVLAAQERGTRAWVVCLRRKGQLADELPSESVILAPPSGRAGLVYPSALASVLRQLAPEVVHLHSGTWYKGALASRLAGTVQVVLTDHGRLLPDPFWTRAFDGIGAQLSDRVVAVSAPLAEYLHTKVHVPMKKLRVIPNGIRLPISGEDADLASLKAEFRLPPGTPIVGTVGRLDAVKAHSYLLTAFGRLVAEWGPGPHPMLVIAGDGPERDRLREQARQAGLGDSVRFLGWRTDAPQLMRLFDLFVLPSDSEGTSISLLEAMGVGCAVIATSVGGTPDVLGAPLQGQLVAARDVMELAHLMRAMLQDPLRRHEVGRIGQDRIRANYSVDVMVRAYDALYEELLLGRSSRKG